MKLDLEIINIHQAQSTGLPSHIYIIWKKKGYNGEYSKLFFKNQRVFESDMQKDVYQKAKIDFPEVFL